MFLKGQPSLKQPAEPLSISGTIKGKVVESSSGTPVEYATVTLYTASDSTMVDGMITDSHGGFEFRKLPSGEYNVIIRFMGYRKMLIEGIVIDQANPVKDVGTVNLRSDVTDLKEVEIVGEKPLVEYQVDRKVVNVDQQITATGGTAVDVLENIPSITTDLEGNVALRGSTNFTVLIDGKPSILTGSDALKQIPASSIDKIEIITNPSAKYDPDGTAGILNIVTKKNSLNGLSGIANLTAGTSPEIAADFTLNYRTKKSSITFGADASNRQMEGFREGYRETYYEDSTEYLQTNSINEMTRKGLNLKAGIDYSLTEKNTITAEASYRMFDMGRDDQSKNQEWSSSDPTRLYYLTLDEDNSFHPTLQVTLRDVHKFNPNGTELSAQLTYNQGDDEGEQTTTQSLMDNTWEQINRVILDYRNNTTEAEKEWRGDLDFDHKFKDGSKLEAGFQLRMDQQDEDYDYYNWDSLSSSWRYDTLRSNRYLFNHDIYALYGTWSKEFKSFGFKLGLRGEYTHRNLDQKTGAEDYLYEKFDLYPSAYFTYYLPYNQQVQLSYSKRVNRPRGMMLNPYPMYSDAFSTFSGNPALEPEFSHALELNYQKLFGYSYLNIESYYRITTNKMTRVQEVNEEGVLESTMENIDDDRSLGVELSGYIKVNDWFNVTPSATVFDYRLNQHTDSSEVTRRSTNWNARLDLGANLKTKTRLRLNGTYDSPSITADGTRKGNFYVGFAVRQDFFNSNLSLTLNIRDVFDSRHMNSTSEGSNFYSEYENWREAPMISLTVSYKWNNYTRKRGPDSGFDGEYDVINMSEF
jgi:outer membrane receptor protein involved in Fe transport